MRALFHLRKKQQPINTQLAKMLVQEPPTPPAELLDGWYHFLHDTVPSLKRQKDAFEYVGDGACKYDLALWQAIRSHMYFRTKRHPDVEKIKQADFAARKNTDFIKQLAFNCINYEAELKSAPDQVALNTLREMTAAMN